MYSEWRVRMESTHFPFQNTHINSNSNSNSSSRISEKMLDSKSIFPASHQRVNAVPYTVCNKGWCGPFAAVVVVVVSICSAHNQQHFYVCVSLALLDAGAGHIHESQLSTTTSTNIAYTHARKVHPLSNSGLPHALFQHYHPILVKYSSRSSILKSV